MKISYSYRGVKTEACSEFCNPRLSDDSVVINQVGWSDGRYKFHQITIQPADLLKTAKSCLLQLGRLGGVEYRIAVIVNGNSNWLE